MMKRRIKIDDGNGGDDDDIERWYFEESLLSDKFDTSGIALHKPQLPSKSTPTPTDYRLRHQNWIKHTKYIFCDPISCFLWRLMSPRQYANIFCSAGERMETIQGDIIIYCRKPWNPDDKTVVVFCHLVVLNCQLVDKLSTALNVQRIHKPTIFDVPHSVQSSHFWLQLGVWKLQQM